MKNKKILVTGGAGFIGSHLCESLAEDNTVYSLDNYSTGSSDNHVPGVTYICERTEHIMGAMMINKFVPDIIYHLGEYSRVEQSFEDIRTVLDYNLTGTKAVLEYARGIGAKLIYAGSSTKYADIGKNASPYAWSKATNTELVKNYGEWFGLDYAITYFYNNYGPREIATGKYATLIALFNEKMKNNETLTVVAPGNQSRNFTHVHDTVAGLELVGEFGKGDEYGIGNPIPYTVLEVAEMFGGTMEMLPPRRGNRISAPVLTEKILELGWRPKVNLADYIKELTSEY